MRNPLRRRARSSSMEIIERDASLSLGQYVQQYISYMGNTYGLGMGGTLTQPEIEAPGSFQGYVNQCYRDNGAVFACMMVRAFLFSEARFQFRQRINGRPGDLFGGPELSVLENPWPNGTTGDLLRKMLTDVDTEGNFFGAFRPGGGVQQLRPDWVTIVAGSKLDADHPNWQRDAEVIGYLYQPGGAAGGQRPEVLFTDQVVHWAPYEDPLSRWRGMSWLTPLMREIMGDTAAMTHKLKYFEHGATSNMTVVLPESVKREDFNAWVEAFSSGHEGLPDAYKTLFFGAGAEVKVIGSDMKQVDFKVTQGHGETRIAAAAGVPPIIAGFSEGLESATYSNYGQARRRFADGTMRPLWRDAAASLAKFVGLPDPKRPGRELWYDDRDIPFLAEDVKDRAEVFGVKATSAQVLIASGWDPDAIIDAVEAEDLKRLVGKHSGLFSVQLQPPVDPNAPLPNADAPAPKQLPAPKAASRDASRDFNPNQPRDPDGKWKNGFGAALKHIDEIGLNEWPKKGEVANRVLGSNKDTREMHTIERDGKTVYTRERHVLHNRIIGENLATGVGAVMGDRHAITRKLKAGGTLTDAEKNQVRTEAKRKRGNKPPTVLFTAGGTASGKSTGLKRSADLIPPDAVSIDPDAIKGELPEYQAMVEGGEKYAAVGAHEESSDLSKRLHSETKALGLNMVIDGTGDSSPGKFEGKFRDMNQAGYDINVMYMTIPADAAVIRAAKRAYKTGRWVPNPEIRNIHASVSENFPSIASLDFVDKLRLYDNLKDGTPPLLVAEGSGGQLTVHESTAYEAFLMKADAATGKPKTGNSPGNTL